MKIIYDQNYDILQIELRPGTVSARGPSHRVNEHISIALDENGAPGAITIEHAAANITEPGTIEFRKIITL
jgi:uncharacterized protein YuzE